MKRLILLLYILCTINTYGQQLPEYTYFQMNKFIINPAFAGIKECMDYRIGAKIKYLSLNQPIITGYASMNGRIKTNKRNFSTNFHGIGGSIEEDKIGITSNTYLNIAYAYNFKLNRKNRVSAGLSIGTIFNRYNISNLNLTHQGDPLLQNSGQKWIFPNIAFGINLYGNNYYVGLSAKQLTKNNYAVGIDGTTRTQIDIISGFIAYDDNNWTIKPAVNIIYTSKSPFAANINVIAEYNHAIAFGVGYKPQEAIALMTKVNIKKRISIAYAFDIVTSSINYNSQEITIGIYTCDLFKSNDIRICPSFE